MTAVFVIDPVADFILPNHVFDLAFGSESVQPLKEVVERIRNVMEIEKKTGSNLTWVLVSSIYKPNQVKCYNNAFKILLKSVILKLVCPRKIIKSLHNKRRTKILNR